MNKIF